VLWRCAHAVAVGGKGGKGGRGGTRKAGASGRGSSLSTSSSTYLHTEYRYILENPVPVLRSSSTYSSTDPPVSRSCRTPTSIGALPEECENVQLSPLPRRSTPLRTLLRYSVIPYGKVVTYGVPSTDTWIRFTEYSVPRPKMNKLKAPISTVFTGSYTGRSIPYGVQVYPEYRPPSNFGQIFGVWCLVFTFVVRCSLMTTSTPWRMEYRTESSVWRTVWLTRSMRSFLLHDRPSLPLFDPNIEHPFLPRTGLRSRKPLQLARVSIRTTKRNQAKASQTRPHQAKPRHGHAWHVAFPDCQPQTTNLDSPARAWKGKGASEREPEMHGSMAAAWLMAPMESSPTLHFLFLPNAVLLHCIHVFVPKSPARQPSLSSIQLAIRSPNGHLHIAAFASIAAFPPPSHSIYSAFFLPLPCFP
jgi:hypothetical protein